jgi:hypothetical protein
MGGGGGGCRRRLGMAAERRLAGAMGKDGRARGSEIGGAWEHQWVTAVL